MNLTHVSDSGAPTPTTATRRGGLVAVTAMGVTGAGLLVYAAVAGARFEMIVAALGLGAGAALVGLLVLSPSLLSVVREDDA